MARLTASDLAEKVHRKAMSELLRNNSGFRRFVWTILDEASIFRTTHSPGHPDTSAFKEGRRSLGLLVKDHLEAAEPAAMILLLQEAAALESLTQATQQQETARSATPSYDLDDEEPAGS